MDGEPTAPGTELDLGGSAIVPFKYGTDKTGTIALTVTAIEQGDPAALAKYGDKAKGLVAYYIRVNVENVSGTDLAHSRPRLKAITADGGPTGVVITGETDQCQDVSAPKDFTTKGAKFDTCVLQAAREGVEVVGATFSESDAYTKSPITWKKK